MWFIISKWSARRYFKLNQTITLTYTISGDDFTRAGEASSDVKKKLKQMGANPEVVRKVAISMYEGEINMVIHAHGGEITIHISSTEVIMILKDEGPGIVDVELAMQAGYSTAPDNVRALGFGAGMGLPNMRKYSDEMGIETILGEGTTVTLKVNM
jgi:anti-sigma regulatory factor (Ser/Thr protein kinase)